MVCPYCGEKELKVIDSRASDDTRSIRRRRECESCHQRFTTYERIEEVPIIVVKKNGLREEFDRSKIHSGIVKACWKRPISLSDIENCVSEIENEIYQSGKMEIDTMTIGEVVMKKLREMDQIAYVRFASVYKKFNDIDSFIEAIKSL
ncbi:MAG: transcriptional regulator NrdR [archaeon]|nr:transcriptional regulator NrdR [archaeon]